MRGTARGGAAHQADEAPTELRVNALARVRGAASGEAQRTAASSASRVTLGVAAVLLRCAMKAIVR